MMIVLLGGSSLGLLDNIIILVLGFIGAGAVLVSLRGSILRGVAVVANIVNIVGRSRLLILILLIVRGLRVVVFPRVSFVVDWGSVVLLLLSLASSIKLFMIVRVFLGGVLRWIEVLAVIIVTLGVLGDTDLIEEVISLAPVWIFLAYVGIVLWSVIPVFRIMTLIGIVVPSSAIPFASSFRAVGISRLTRVDILIYFHFSFVDIRAAADS